jgi:hypothetical protein
MASLLMMSYHYAVATNAFHTLGLTCWLRYSTNLKKRYIITSAFQHQLLSYLNTCINLVQHKNTKFSASWASWKKTVKYSAACDSMAVGTVQGFPHIVHSLSVLKEHVITYYCKKKKMTQTYQCFTRLAKIDPLLLPSMPHGMKTSSVTYSEVLRQIFAMHLYEKHTTPLLLHCIMALGDRH